MSAPPPEPSSSMTGKLSRRQRRARARRLEAQAAAEAAAAAITVNQTITVDQTTPDTLARTSNEAVFTINQTIVTGPADHHTPTAPPPTPQDETPQSFTTDQHQPSFHSLHPLPVSTPIRPADEAISFEQTPTEPLHPVSGLQEHHTPSYEFSNKFFLFHFIFIVVLMILLKLAYEEHRIKDLTLALALCRSRRG
ncbi:MAG: hypothetical protein Q9219_005081 [cf. Caloplaca sp. 3 TL-2023]